MMMSGGNFLGGFVKAILGIAILAAILSGVAAFALGDSLTELPLAQAEADGVQAQVDQERDKWQIQQPYYAQQLAAENEMAVAELARQKALLEAQTQADLANITAETENHAASLYDKRRMDLAEHQQALVEADRWNQVGATLAMAAGIGLAAATAVSAVLVVNWLIGRKKAVQPALAQIDLWQDPVSRRQRIDYLRHLDEKERRELLRQAKRPAYPNGDPRPARIRPSDN